MPVLDATGKLGDLGDRAGDKIRTLICLDWDPDCMFPFTDGLSCHRISELCRPLVTVRFRSIPPTPIYSRLGVLCSSKLSLLSHPPRSCLYLSLSIYLTCSLSPAPSCVPRPFQLLGDPTLTVYCPPLSLLRPQGRGPVSRDDRADVPTL